MQVYYGAPSDLFPQEYECLIILVMGLCLQWPQSLSPTQGTAPEATSQEVKTSCPRRCANWFNSAVIEVRNLLMLHAVKISTSLVGLLLVTYDLKGTSVLLFSVLALQLITRRQFFWYLLSFCSFAILLTQYILRITTDVNKTGF